MSSHVIETHTVLAADGSSVRLTEDQNDIYQAMLVCERRGMVDATRREVLEVVSAQLQRQVPEHTYSGRFSELVRLGVLEECSKRDDRFTLALRAVAGRACRVTAWRIKKAAPAAQGALV